MSNKLVTVARFSDSILASIAQQCLADFGVHSVLAGRNAAELYSLPEVALVELQILESEAVKARQILKSQRVKGATID